MPRLTKPLSPAKPTTTALATVLEVANKGVGFVKFVVVFAMCGFLKLSNPSAVGILASREKSEVVGVNAFGISAHVVNCEIAENVANEKLVRYPMGAKPRLLPASSSFAYVTVATLIQSTKPLPAVGIPIKLNKLSKSINQRPCWFTCDLLVSLVNHPPPLLPISYALFFGELWPRLNLKFVNLYRLPRNILKALVPLAIIPMAQKVKMIRVNASSISACVVNLSSMWNNSIEYLKRYAVGLNAATFPADLKLPVSLSGEARGPIPTSGFSVQFKLLYESIKQWSVLWHNNKSAPHPRCESRTNERHLRHGANRLVICFWRQIQCRAQFLPHLGF